MALQRQPPCVTPALPTIRPSASPASQEASLTLTLTVSAGPGLPGGVGRGWWLRDPGPSLAILLSGSSLFSLTEVQ